MNKKILSFIIGLIVLIGIIIIFININNNKKEIKDMKATIISNSDSLLTIQDSNNAIYTFKTDKVDASVGESILISYTGIIDKNTELQNVSIVDYTTSPVLKDENGIPKEWLDNGIFSDYYILAYNKLKTLSLDEKIGQLFLVRYPDNNAIEALKKYKFGGYLFFEKDFKNKTKNEVINMTKNVQSASKIPLLTAVDEEGGKVVRVSSNPNLAKEKFKSPSELYDLGGFNKIKDDTIEKSNLLNSLGLNLNLAPVVDVSTDPNNYMYNRTIQEDTEITSKYAETVINASKGTKVSYTLKHFPGYGNNSDTHTGGSTDNRTLEDITKYDLPPFKSGIKAGAEAVLVSHNTVTSIDKTNPASLSPSVHNLLRNDLGFTGVIITDDLDMTAVSSINDVTVKAILAGNDLIITTDYKESIDSVKDALNTGRISEDLIDKLAFRIIAWKYYKGLMFENQK